MFFLFAPSLLHAQEDEPVPWPCRAMNAAGRTIIIPCDAKRSADVNPAQSFDVILKNRADETIVAFNTSSGSRNTVQSILIESRDDAVALITNRRMPVMSRRATVSNI
jgi:hypothetical protein